MRRLHLVELHDLKGFPAAWRAMLTDFMSFFALRSQIFQPVFPLVWHAVRSSGAECIVDLCAGAGGPALALWRARVACDGPSIPITLTDKFPNLRALGLTAAESSGALVPCEHPVDASDVPAELCGFRTLFASFHHFRPEAARAILADAARKRQGIAVCEYTERNCLIWALPIAFTPLAVWAATPCLGPMTWRRILWTYLLPVVPLVAAWDGFVSCLRSYSIPELRHFTEELSGLGYRWEIGRVRAFGACRVTYLIGVPTPGAPQPSRAAGDEVP